MSVPVRAMEAHVGAETVHGVLTGEPGRTMILLHGLLSDHRELGPLPRSIAETGTSVLAPDLRGHGQSEGARGVISVERVLEDLVAWRYQLAELGSTVVAVGGHSLGGTMSLRAASTLKAKALVCIASPGSIKAELSATELAFYRTARVAERLASTFGIDGLTVPYKVGPEDVLDDPECVTKAKDEHMIQKVIPLANVGALLRVDGTAWARDVKCEGLFVVASRDRVVDAQNSRSMYAAYAGPKTWLEIQGPHSLFLDRTAEAAAATIADWVRGALS